MPCPCPIAQLPSTAGLIHNQHAQTVSVANRYPLLPFGSQASLRTLDQRGQAVRLVARRWGRIEGSVRSRTLYL